MRCAESYFNVPFRHQTTKVDDHPSGVPGMGLENAQRGQLATDVCAAFDVSFSIIIKSRSIRSQELLLFVSSFRICQIWPDECGVCAAAEWLLEDVLQFQGYAISMLLPGFWLGFPKV